MDSEKLHELKKAINAEGFDGWLFFDFHNRDPISYRVLGLDPGKFTSRRWFYWIPASGEPVKIVSKVEPSKLDSLPGEKLLYLSWQELRDQLKRVLQGARKVAMQYSPMGAIPYVSMVDAGTIDMIRSLDVEVGSSANLVQRFEALLDDHGFKTHAQAGEKIHAIKDEAFKAIHQALLEEKNLTQYDVQQLIVKRFEEEGLTCDGEYPIVGAAEQPADPHFCPTPQNSRPFRWGDTILIDLWAKLKEPGAIYYDITWCGYAGEEPPEKYKEIFKVVVEARDAALEFVKNAMARGDTIKGWEVDKACRGVVEKSGWGEYFIHRTGHSIGENVHGNGVNMDDLETRDERVLMPGICFSIEPGIYIEGEMAVRTEIDVFIKPDGSVEVVGPIQRDLILLRKE